MQVPPHATSGAGHDSVQVPATQISPASHTSPASPAPSPQPSVAPQWLRSVFGFTQVSSHAMSEPGQEITHSPDSQISPASHAIPAVPPFSPQPSVAPQYRRRQPASLHAPLHSISPACQERAQLPPLQTSPPAHVSPAVPSPLSPHPAVAPQ